MQVRWEAGCVCHVVAWHEPRMPVLLQIPFLFLTVTPECICKKLLQQLQLLRQTCNMSLRILDYTVHTMPVTSQSLLLVQRLTWPARLAA